MLIDILHCPRSSNRTVQLIVHSMAFIDGSSNKDWEGGLRRTDLRYCTSINILYRTIVLHTCINIILAFSYPFTGVIFGICLAVCQVELIVVAIATGLIVHFVTKGCIKQNLTLSQDRSENTAELTKQLHATKIKTHRPFKTAQIVEPYTPLHLVQTNLTQVTINHVYRHTNRKPTQ